MPVDTHVTICPYFTVPEGKMDEFKKGFGDFYEKTRAGTAECLYYGFCVSGNKVFCREGYRSAAGVLAHLGDVKAPLDKALAIVGEGGLDLSVMGPAQELEKLKEAMGPLGTKFWESEKGSMWFKGCDEGPDTHITIVPYFTVPADKRDDFMKATKDCLRNTRRGTKDSLYYGFCCHEDKVFCREGYQNSDAVLQHLKDVKAPVDKMVEICGGLDLHIMGPAADLAKLKDPLKDLNPTYWETDSGSFWHPGPSDPKVAPAPEGATEMKVTMKKGTGFYINAACSFLRGVEAKPAEDGKEAQEAKPSVEYLRISGLGEAIPVAIASAQKAVNVDLGTIIKVQTAYPSMEGSGRGCGQIIIDMKRK
jgi:quinol monooxygenase YgiN